MIILIYLGNSIGLPRLYYKDLNTFGSYSFLKENVVERNMNFTISESKDTADFSKYEYPSTCSVPLTIGYINENIKTNYTLPITSSKYDGELLRQAVITLDSIACNVSFDIHIVNNLDENFKCSINFDIPLKDDESKSSIYDGYFVKELTDFENYVFVKE